MPTDEQLKAHLEKILVNRLVRVHRVGRPDMDSLVMIVREVARVSSTTRGTRVDLKSPGGSRYYYYFNGAKNDWHLDTIEGGCPHED